MPARTSPLVAVDGRVTRTSIEVRFCETDLVGIVHHSNYLPYFEAGRIDWLRERGIRYEDWAKQGIHFPVVEAHVYYRKPARFGDTLVVCTACVAVTRVTVRFGYVILRSGAAPPEDVVCEGETRLCCVGPSLTPERLPAVLSDIGNEARR